MKKLMNRTKIQRPEIVLVASNKTDRQYLVRYKALTKYLAEMMTLQHLGQPFTRRALRKWCKKNTITEPKDLVYVSVNLDDYIHSWDDVRDALRQSIVRDIGNQQTARMSDSRDIENLQLEHVRLDQHHIYFNEKIQDLKWRDKQRFAKALNKLIEDFEAQETWQANHSIARRRKVVERLINKWKGKQ